MQNNKTPTPNETAAKIGGLHHIYKRSADQGFPKSERDIALPIRSETQKQQTAPYLKAYYQNMHYLCRFETDRQNTCREGFTPVFCQKYTPGKQKAEAKGSQEPRHTYIIW